jgi:hypothetical protein
MALIDLWKSDRTQFDGKQVHQIIAFAGAGRLLDGSPASHEFREFLLLIGSALLIRFVDDCLLSKFDGSGLALQDIVNEIGRRLGFSVKPGRYRGAAGQIGFDGIWRVDGERSIIVEVKTTDAYRMDLNTFAGYRKSLARSGEIIEDQSSILIVVGRDDTGDMEAQIRGSRHAWDIRLISVDGLIRLLKLKEVINDPGITEKMWTILVPREYTKVDGIIEVVFSTAEEVQRDEELEQVERSTEDEQTGPQFVPVSFHDACIVRLEQWLKTPLVKRSRTTFLAPEGQLAVVCAVSREHEHGSNVSYWFAFHPHQKDFIELAATSYVCFGCGSERQLLAIQGRSSSRGWRA